MTPPLNGFHLSVDDVFNSLIDISDWQLNPLGHPFFAFCSELASCGANVHLYLFRKAARPDGRVRRLDDITERTAEELRKLPGIRFGPHAEDYATRPYAQTLNQQDETMRGLFGQISRIATPEQRARWLRLHYFSECIELAPLWRQHGVDALFTTDKPDLCYSLGADNVRDLRVRSWTVAGGMTMIRSHLRLENFLQEATKPQRFLDRIDAILEELGFVTLFTHEDDLRDSRVRALALASVGHLARRGVPSF